MPLFIFSFYSLPSFLQQKVFLLWIARTTLHTAVVLLSTVVLALFIAHYSPLLIPLVLLGQAIFLMIGSTFIMPLLKKLSIKTMFFVWIFIAIIFLAIALLVSSFFVQWSILLFVLSFALWHGVIFFALYIEQIFSPQEAEHAIPLIESGEPIGGIIAGAIAAFGAYFLSPDLLLTGILFLLLISIIIMWRVSWVVEDIQMWKHIENEPMTPRSIFLLFPLQNPLLKKLFWATILQAIIFVIIEFQYLLAVAELIPHSTVSVEQEVVQQLAHGLGLFHLIVFGSLFILQIFFAAWIQKMLGVIRSFFMQPLLLWMNAFGFLLFSFLPLGMIGKGIYEVSGGVYKNAMASVFYVFKVHSRESYREILEGIAKPIGMIIGSILLICVSTYFHAMHLSNTLLLHFLGIGLMVLCVVYWWTMKNAPNDYTRLAKRNLELPHFHEEKFDAIEILSQKGHHSPAWILLEALQNPIESDFVKEKIFEAIAIQKDIDVFSEIITFLETSTSESLQFSALSCLHAYTKEKSFPSYPFTKHRIIHYLQHLFRTAESKRIRLKIIEILSMVRYSEMVPFLLEGIDNENPDIAFCSILACGSFRDISTASILLPHLQNKNAYILSATIISLWHFKKYREVLFSYLLQMVRSSDNNMKMSAIYTIGEIQIMSERKTLIALFETSEDIHIKKHAAIALAKMGSEEMIPFLASLLFHKDVSVSSSTHKLLYSPGVRLVFSKHLSAFIRQKILYELRAIAKESDYNINTIAEEKKEKIAWLYTMLGSHAMALKITNGL